MKTIYLLRHGKSDWDADFDRDRDRPIGKRGRRAARKIARFMETNDIHPDIILCSDALRTRQTIGHVLDELEWPQSLVRYDERLYLAPVERLYEVIRELTDESSALVVGHEPTLARAAARMTETPDIDVPTATLVGIALDIEGWQETEDESGRLTLHVKPRSLQ